MAITNKHVTLATTATLIHSNAETSSAVFHRVFVSNHGGAQHIFLGGAFVTSGGVNGGFALNGVTGAVAPHDHIDMYVRPGDGLYGMVPSGTQDVGVMVTEAP